MGKFSRLYISESTETREAQFSNLSFLNSQSRLIKRSETTHRNKINKKKAVWHVEWYFFSSTISNYDERLIPLRKIHRVISKHLKFNFGIGIVHYQLCRNL